MSKSKNLANMFFIKLFSIIISILSTTFLARILGPNNYGYIPYISSLVIVLVLFFDFGVSSSTAYHLRINSNDKKKILTYFYSSFFLKCFLLLVTTIFIILITYYTGLSLITFVLPFLFVLFSLNKYFKKVAESFMLVSLSNLFIPIMLIIEKIFIIVFIYFFTSIETYYYIHVGFSLITILIVFIYIMIRKKLIYRSVIVKKFIKIEAIKKILKYSFPLFISAVGFYIFMQSDILMIRYFLGIQYVSYYSISSKVSSLIIFPAVIITSSYVPKLVKLIKNNEKEIFITKFTSIIKILFIVYLLSSVLIMFYPKEVVLLLYGNEFIIGQSSLQTYSLFFFFYGLMTFSSVFLDYYGEAKIRSILLIIASVLNILLNLFLIPQYGIIGAAISTQITYIPYAVICLYVLYRKIKLKLNIKSILWVLKIIITISTILLINSYIIISVNNLFIRISIILISVIFILFIIYKMNLFTNKDIKNVVYLDI